MTDFPAGTITFLFTDMEGSTRLWEEHPGLMPAVMGRHDALVEAAVEGNRGRVVRPRGEGDSRFAVFESAADAVRAAAAIQVALAGGFDDLPFPVRVRIGLHTGAAEWRDGDYYGSAVNRCARIRSLAFGGQTLMSQVTAELARDDLPPGAALLGLGTHRLKGLNRPETLYQLWLPGLPNDFPSLRSEDEHLTNLPTPPEPIIGREQEVSEVMGLLTDDVTRLVTLTGPGGTGKTRLSLEIGRLLLPHYPGGLYFVDLAPITDPLLVASTIAHTMGIREGGGRPPFDNLKDHLAGKQVFLILDNLEQVVSSAPIIAGLLASAPGVRMLATSRIPLQIRGEREYPVDILQVPPAGMSDPESLLEYEAVRFFVRRAQAARPAFQLGPDNAEAVGGICRRLDGLPLGIEIAAARIRMLPPAAILKRLDQSLKLLVGGAADLPERQQTVRGAIDWSYQLLKPEEQTLFARLGVFVGGFTLENAEAVCNSDRSLDVFTGVEALVRNSLVRQVEWVGDEPRFDMLLTIRDFALERLAELGELPSTRAAHALHFSTWAEQHFGETNGPKSLKQLILNEADHGNFRATMAWGIEPGNDPLVAAWVDLYLEWFWYMRGYIQEGREWSERIAHATEAIGGVAQAMSMMVASAMAMWHGDLDMAEDWIVSALKMAEEDKHDLGISMGHFSYGVILINQGRDREAHGHLTFAAERFDEGEMAFEKVNTLIHLANASLGLGEFKAAEAWLREAMLLAEQVGDPWQIAFCLNNFGEVARAHGDYDQARQYYERSEAMYREADALGDHARLVHTLGYMALHDGDRERAESQFLESLAAFRRLGNKRGMAECLAGLAGVGAQSGRSEWAATLLSAAEAQMTAGGAAWWPADRPEIERTRRQLREVLGEETFARMSEQAQGISLEAAIAFAED